MFFHMLICFYTLLKLKFWQTLFQQNGFPPKNDFNAGSRLIESWASPFWLKRFKSVDRRNWVQSSKHDTPISHNIQYCELLFHSSAADTLGLVGVLRRTLYRSKSPCWVNLGARLWTTFHTPWRWSPQTRPRRRARSCSWSTTPTSTLTGRRKETQGWQVSNWVYLTEKHI